MLDISDQIVFLDIQFIYKSGVAAPPERFAAKSESPIAERRKQFEGVHKVSPMPKGSKPGEHDSKRFETTGMGAFLREKDFALVELAHEYENLQSGTVLNICLFIFARNRETDHKNEITRLVEFENLTEEMNWKKAFKVRPDRPFAGKLYLSKPRFG